MAGVALAHGFDPNDTWTSAPLWSEVTVVIVSPIVESVKPWLGSRTESQVLVAGCMSFSKLLLAFRSSPV